MNRLINKVKSILTGNSGETLMEGVVSLLIFNILMLSVTTMIKTSLTITENSTIGAAARQEKANEAILETYSSASKNLVLEGHSTGINVEIPVNFSTDSDPDAFVAFAP